MSPLEFKSRMAEAVKATAVDGMRDKEREHVSGDDLLCEALEQLGYGEGVEIWRQRANEWWWA